MDTTILLGSPFFLPRRYRLQLLTCTVQASNTDRLECPDGSPTNRDLHGHPSQHSTWEYIHLLAAHIAETSFVSIGVGTEKVCGDSVF